MHVFFKLTRPVDIPLESDTPFLPALYVLFLSNLRIVSYTVAATARRQDRQAAPTTENNRKVRSHVRCAALTC